MRDLLGKDRSINAGPAMNRMAGTAFVLGTSEAVGGTERSVIEMAETVPGCAVYAWDSQERGIKAAADAADIEVHYFSHLWILVRDLRRSKPDVIWAFGLRTSILLRLARAAGLLRSPRWHPRLVSAQRGLDSWRRRPHNVADRFTSRWVDLYACNSFAAADMLAKAVGADPAKLWVHDPVLGPEWLDEVSSNPAHVKRRLIIIGSDRSEKAHDIAARALAESGCLPDLEVTVYTSRSTSAGWQYEDLKVHGVRVIHGRLLTPAILDDADILLHVSRSESLPRAVLECAARGLIIICTDVGDTLRIPVAHRVVVRVDDVADVARGIRKAVNDPQYSVRERPRELGGFTADAVLVGLYARLESQ